jgi:hypothetical protein
MSDVAAYIVWGTFGGFAVEGMEFSKAVRATGDWPWRQKGEPGALPMAISIIIRLAVSGGLSLALGQGHQIIGVFGALTAGVAAPLILEQLSARVPLVAPNVGSIQIPALIAESGASAPEGNAGESRGESDPGTGRPDAQ